MIRVICIYFLPIILFGKLRVYVDPAQQINTIKNYNIRNVYAFIQKNADGSVLLQTSPSPFSSFNKSLADAGAAYIDSPEVVKTFTKEEVTSNTHITITFNVIGYPNRDIQKGYQIYGIIPQWSYYLDINSQYYNQMQALKIPVNAIFQLNNDNASTNNQLVYTYLDIIGFYKWVSTESGVYISKNSTNNIFYETNIGGVSPAQEQTLTVDSKFLSRVSPGIYTSTFIFRMQPIDEGQSFSQYLSDLSTIQITQMRFLYRNILNINAELNGTNNLYTRSPAQTAILKKNKALIVSEYKTLIAAMSSQWESFSSEDNLTTQSLSIIRNMQSFITTFQGYIPKF